MVAFFLGGAVLFATTSAQHASHGWGGGSRGAGGRGWQLCDARRGRLRRFVLRVLTLCLSTVCFETLSAFGNDFSISVTQVSSNRTTIP
jgi:hypothetical protein